MPLSSSRPAARVLERHPSNPILHPRRMPFPCAGVYNSGVVKTAGGDYIMASRVEEPSKRHHAWISRSRDGVQFTPDPEPLRVRCHAAQQAEFDDATRIAPPGLGTWWDPRLNPLEGEHYLTYAAVSKTGCRIGLARVAPDFRSAQHLSFPHHIQNRNAVLFPEKIGGLYWMLHRPQHPNGGGSIWISASPDLHFWGQTRPVAHPHRFWEHKKIGPAAPPIRTAEGWLIVHHGVFPHCNGVNYAAGAMLLDLEQPWRVVARGAHPILWVEEPYEMVGQVPNVVFPGAVIPETDGSVKVYYGGADYVQCLATGTLAGLLAAARASDGADANRHGSA